MYVRLEDSRHLWPLCYLKGHFRTRTFRVSLYELEEFESCVIEQWDHPTVDVESVTRNLFGSAQVGRETGFMMEERNKRGS